MKSKKNGIFLAMTLVILLFAITTSHITLSTVVFAKDEADKSSGDEGKSTNHPPVAVDQQVTTNKNNPVDIALSGTDEDKNTLIFTIITAPSHGALSEIDPQTGVVAYSPEPDYIGDDSFTFMVNDGTVNSTNTGTVSVAVTDVEQEQLTSNSESATQTTPGLPNDVVQGQNAPILDSTTTPDLQGKPAIAQGTTNQQPSRVKDTTQFKYLSRLSNIDGMFEKGEITSYQYLQIALLMKIYEKLSEK